MNAEELESWDETVTGEVLSIAPDAVEVRRNGGLAAFVGAAASAVAIAYLGRAAQTGALLDWALVVVMGLLGAAHLRSFVDARTPLLVADTQGVRIRLGHTWRGLPWGALAEVEHTPRRGILRDGRLVLRPHNPARVLDELDAGGRRQVAVSEKVYGAPFAVPLGLTTRVAGIDEDLTTSLRVLAGASARVVEVVPETVAEAEPVEEFYDVEADIVADDHDEFDDYTEPREPRFRDPRPALAAGIGAIAARFSRPERAEAVETDWTEDEGEPTQDLPLVASATPQPLREPRSGNRAEVRRDLSQGAAALDLSTDDDATRRDLPEARELRRAGSVNLVEDTVAWGDRVRPIAKVGDAVEPLVIDAFEVEPADNPVIGPELAASRTRLGLTVDQLADRTRIRPHVIESIEVDDFAPCGGDFYARGHLRTLARVLGADVTPLLTAYDERYADAPINPRRVFEAELATGMNGSIRSTRGGPNWSVLIAAIMAIVLAWSIARLIMDTPVELHSDAPALNGSAGVNNDPAPVVSPIRVRLAANGAAHVVVRDGDGKVVFSGNLTQGSTKTLKVAPPVNVRASDGGVVKAFVNGKNRGPLGEPGAGARKTFKAG